MSIKSLYNNADITLRRLFDSRYFLIFVSIISFIVVVAYILTAHVHVDEGWFQSVAKAKNYYGYYTFPPFYDIQEFKGELLRIRGLLIQLNRFFLFFLSPELSIWVIRLIFFAGWILSYYFFIAHKYFKFDLKQKIILLNLAVVFPSLFWIFGIARAEIPISALICFILVYFLNNSDSYKDRKKSLLIGFIAFLFHPNGLLILIFVLLLSLKKNNIYENLKLIFIFLFYIWIYFYFFIDPNIPLFLKQNKILYTTGSEKKFLFNFENILAYFYDELTGRYFNLESIKENYLSFELITSLSSLFVIALGLYTIYKERMKKIFIFVVLIMLSFVFLGNKTPLYLAYLLPVLIAFSYSEFSNKIRRLGEILILLLSWGIIAYSIFINVTELKMHNKALKMLFEYSKPDDTIYAPFEFSPFIGNEYRYLTTTQKTKSGFYKLFNIKPSKCVVLTYKDDDIWNNLGGEIIQQDTVGKFIIAEVN